MKDWFFTFSLAAIGRILVWRDRRDGTYPTASSLLPQGAERFTMTSGGRRLDTILVSAGENAPAVVICHGIGEVIEYWGKIQALLRSLGVSSLIFDYSGYGASTGL